MANKIFQILRNSTVYNDYTTAAAAFNVPADVTGLIDGQLKSARYVDGNTEKAIIGIWNSTTEKWSMIDIESSLLHAVLNAKQINVTDPSSNETKALDEVIFENETVTAAALNDLNEKIMAIENANFGDSINNAISTAAGDATTKANAAKEAAISASNVTLVHDDGTLNYTLYQGTDDNKSNIGEINIPKDMVVESGSVITATSDDKNNDSTVTVGEKYIKLVVTNVPKPLYIAVHDLYKDHTAAEGATEVQVAISDNNVISATIVNVDASKVTLNDPEGTNLQDALTTINSTLNNKQNIIDDLSTIRNKATTAYQKPDGGIPATDLAEGIIPSFTIVNDHSGAGDDPNKIYIPSAESEKEIHDGLSTISQALSRVEAADQTNASAITAIEGKIPDAATSENQLADKDFVNSSIATATASFPFKKTEHNGIDRNDGFHNSMTNKGSVALGENGMGSGIFAVTEGFRNTADGNYSHAEGDTTKAMGRCSKSEGEGTYAIGNNAHACGSYTTASGDNQFVIGKYNIKDSSSLFIIGNGTTDGPHPERANALTVDRQGNLWIAGNLQNDQMSEIKASISTLKADWIEFDQNILSPNSMISGDVRGNVLKWIRNNSHRFLGKYTAEGEMTICQLDDSDGTKYKDGGNATLNGTQGDVFMRLPEFYTHFEQVTDKIFRVGFSRYNLGTGWKKWGDNDLIGVYEAVNMNHKLSSVAGSIPRGNMSYQDLKTMVTERGNGYSLVKWKHQNIMAFLYYAFYGDTDCQTRIGLGGGYADRTCGAANSLGMTDGQVNDNISFWGLENWWGGKDEIIDNVSVNGMKWSITEDDNTVREVISNIPTNNWNVATALIAGEHLDVIPLTVESTGSSTTGFCDGIYIDSSNNKIVTRSGSSNNPFGGVAYECVHANTTRDIGTRIAFKGSIVVINDHVAFEAIPSIN